MAAVQPLQGRDDKEGKKNRKKDKEKKFEGTVERKNPPCTKIEG